MNSPIRTFAAIVAGILVVAACEQKEAPKAERPPPEVGIVTVEPRDIPLVSSFVAQTESSRQVDIVARVSGFLDRIAYQEGDVVRAGQILFQLDPKPFKAQLEAAKGVLLAQQARLSTALANLNRIRPLAAQNALPQADLDRAQGEHDAARAAVFSAEAQVTEAELNLGYTTIRSPVTGLASRSLQREGAFVNAMSENARLTYVAALDPIWVNFSVSQNLMAKMRGLVEKGRLIPPENGAYEIELVLSTGKVYPYEGRINFADPSFSQDTGSFLVRAVLPNPKQELRPGMFVTANVKGAYQPKAIVIPQLAVQQGSNGHLVYVVKLDGTAEVRPVVVGDYHGENEIVVVTGLVAGDRVVAEGVLKVVPGRPVKVVERKTAAGPGATGTAPGSEPVPRATRSENDSSGADESKAGARPAGARSTATDRAAPALGREGPRAPAAAWIGASSYGPVRAGDTLLEIAQQVRSEGVSVAQAAVGIYRANPDAFTGNLDALKAGVILRVPEPAELAAIDREDAAREVWSRSPSARGAGGTAR